MIMEGTNATLCRKISDILTKQSQVKVTVKQGKTGRDRVEGYPEGNMDYDVEGKTLVSEIFSDVDKEGSSVLVHRYAQNMSQYLEDNLENAKVVGPETSDDFFVVKGKKAVKKKRSKPKEPQFELPSGRYDMWQVANLLGTSAMSIKNSKIGLYNEIDRVDASTVHQLARKRRVSDNRLRDNYEKHIVPKMIDKRFLEDQFTVDEAAVILGVSSDELHYWKKHGVGGQDLQVDIKARGILAETVKERYKTVKSSRPAVQETFDF